MTAAIPTFLQGLQRSMEFAQATRKRRSTGERKTQGFAAPNGPEIWYRKQLGQVVKLAESEVMQMVGELQQRRVIDAPADDVAQAVEFMRRQLTQLEFAAEFISQRFVNMLNGANSRRFYRQLEGLIGVNLEGIIQSEGLDDALALGVQQNVSLIKTIPRGYFDKIEAAVMNNLRQGSTHPRGLLGEIQDIGGVTENRARFIARDQTSKINGQLTQERSLSLGIEEYIWRDSRDVRVRRTHRAQNGKRYQWDDPPSTTGHPGWDYRCRCKAQSVIPASLLRR